jgi:hypothetical protein
MEGAGADFESAVTRLATPSKLKNMSQQTQNNGEVQSIDVTGLPEAAVRAVQSLVALLREKQGEVTMPSAFSSREEWVHAVRVWAERHPTRDTLADDGRETIFAGRGE